MPAVHSSPRAYGARESERFLIEVTVTVPGIRYLSFGPLSRKRSQNNRNCGQDESLRVHPSPSFKDAVR
jgi:hypothetical protein